MFVASIRISLPLALLNPPYPKVRIQTRYPRPSKFQLVCRRYFNPNFFIQLHIHCGIQSPLEGIGGYVFPSLVTLGVQVHRFSSGMLSMTLGICLPQPHQEAFSGAKGQFGTD